MTGEDCGYEKYEALLGHFKLSWAKVTSMIQIQGPVGALASHCKGVLSAQLQFRLDGKLPILQHPIEPLVS